MADPGRRETLRAAAPVRLGSATVLAIERVVVRSGSGRGGLWVAAEVEPCAVVVRDAGGLRALALDGAALSLAQLRGNVPGLDELLRA